MRVPLSNLSASYRAPTTNNTVTVVAGTKGGQHSHSVMKTLIRCVIPLLFSASLSAQTGTLQFSSPPGQVSLLELYTSQGCSSCPPADAWLSTLVDHPKLWRELIPVAFHVDYWDRLGWKDPFGSADNTRRQYQHQRSGATRAVYTPGFLLNGREWRGRGRQGWLPERGLQGAALSVGVVGERIVINYEHTEAALDVHVALLGFGLETPVGAGENRRKTLREDFVMLAHTTATMQDGHWRATMPVSAAVTERRALVVWVSQPGQAQALQAAGGWLPTDRDR